jgi:hypothetical protein
MKKLLFIVFVFMTSISCDKNDFENSTLDGVWVEVNHKTDSLVFNSQEAGLNLNRGTEMRNGYLLPKYHSGSYWYEIKNDSISLRWITSSSSYANKYYFKPDLKNKKIIIGNFFVDSIKSGTILTFIKIK